MAKNNDKHPSGGNKLKGNDKPYANLADLEKELKKGFAYVNITKIRNYRDGVKDITAQILRKGLNKYNSNLQFDFESFINNIYEFENNKKESNNIEKEDDEIQELKKFYSCFYDYFNNKSKNNIASELSHYKRRNIQIMKRAILDIEYYINNNLLEVYNTLIKEYNYYKPKDKKNKLLLTINKLKVCYDIIDQICGIVRFLFFEGLSNSISKDAYDELIKMSCNIKDYYKETDADTFECQKNNITYISLGDKGAAYFYKKFKE